MPKQNLSNRNRLTLSKFLSMLLVVAVLVLLLPAVGYAAFSDVREHWGQTAIEKWSGLGIVRGADGAFRPDDPITRGEMAVIIDNVMHYQRKAENNFSDLGQAFYTDAILKANAAGVINGDGAAVRPADKITREEAAVMLGRALGLRENATGSAAFSDAAEISSWAAGYINAMANAGYVQGANGQFNPKDSITRAEVVTILNSSVKQLCNEKKEYTGNVRGMAIVNTPGVALNDMKISGDLIIAEGVGDGDIILNNVTVMGNTLVRGGGSDSIHIQGGSQISRLIIEKTDDGSIRVVTSEGAVVAAVLVEDGTDDIILTGSFDSITVAADVAVKAVDARIGQVDVTAGDAVLNVDQDSVIGALNVAETAADTKITVFGRVETLTANAKISVNNQGTITRMQINANGVAIEGNAPAAVNVATTVTDTTPAAGSSSISGGTSSGGGGGSSSKVFAGGSGTVSSPYQIETAAQLNKVRNYLDKQFILTADIDLSGYENWTPIGTLNENIFENGGHSTVAFSGTFDGNGHTVSNLTATHQDLAGVGLFGAASSDALIKNLTVENASVTGYMSVAGIIGLNCGSVENLTLKGENTISSVNCTGGILGGHGFGTIKNCHVEDVTINVLGDNDFSSGPIIQCDVAECGGLVVGGAFTGSIKNCSARGEIIAGGNEPVGLGGIGGCLEYMENITGCTADVTITAPNSAHAVGGLCGYAGTGDIENPAVIKDCSVKFAMNTANATHAGGLVGTGLYFMGMETVFSISNCSTEGEINGAVTPGTIAGRAENCTIADCTSDVLIDGVQGTAEIGTTERMYESADQPEGFENLCAWANRGSGSYESLVNYVNDEALSDVWDAAASSETAQMMAGMFGVQVTDGASLKAMFANMASTPANNGAQIYQIKFGYNYKTIYFCDQDGNVIESHPYTFVESNDNLGMLAGETTYVFKADDDAGVLTYIAMLKPHFDEAMDETTMPAHVHFYYAATKDTLGTYKPDSVTLSGWMPTMLQMGDEFSTADKSAMLECLFGIDNVNEAADIGILVVAHGSGENWNQRVRESVAEVNVPYPVELGFLDVETEDIEMAVQALEEKGVKRIVAVPIFVCSASSHMEEIKYMLGLPSSLNDEAAQEEGLERIEMTAAVELTSALDDHLMVAEILNERVEKLSQDAQKEIVVLVAHGTSNPENLAVWKEKMASLGDKLQQIHGFKQVHCGFVGAGTPNIRTVVEEVKNNNPDCTVIVMPVMLSEGVYTDSKIPTSLDGITYLYPEAGQRALLPHANIALYIASRSNDAIMGDIELQESGQTYVVQYSDVALEEGGKVCVCGSLAYRAMQEALKVLSPGTVAERSRFTVFGPNSEGTEAALQAILGDGRYQLKERPQNEDYYSYQITDCESGTIITVKARPEVFPDSFFALKTKVKNNNATSEEKKAFQALRAQVVEKVRWEDADNLFTIEASPAFAGGSGTESDPYQIATAEQLDQVRNHLDKSFILTVDVDLAGYENWEPIGTFQPVSSAPEDAENPDPEMAFSGAFDGNGHSISNVKIDLPTSFAVGLFGCDVGSESNLGSIHDLTVETVDVTGYYLAGGVVDLQHQNFTLENVALTGLNMVQGLQGVGGIVGTSFDTVKDCSAIADITIIGDDGACAGVVVGGTDGGSLIDCTATGGSVTATGNSCWALGGVCGAPYSAPEITNCEAENVTITASGINNRLIGGLVGFTGTYGEDDPTSVTGCTVTSTTITVSAGTTCVGGLVGGSTTGSNQIIPSVFAIDSCSTSGTITGGSESVGSIAGYAYNSTVVNCTSTMTWGGGTLEQVGLTEPGIMEPMSIESGLMESDNEELNPAESGSGEPDSIGAVNVDDLAA